MKLYIDNDNLIKLVGLRDEAAGAYVNDAAVDVTLLDSSDTEVAGETWPLTMPYVAGSDGDYQAVLQDSLPIAVRERYKAVVAAVGNGLQGRWVVTVQARQRGV